MKRHLLHPIFLCGFMGAGKSTLGRKLAAHLEVPFTDLDQEIENITGSTIPEIFQEAGEEGFRKTERQVLLEVIRKKQGVIALGGGSLHDGQLVEELKQNGTLIFIEVPFSVILDRIEGDRNRPLLVDEQGKHKSRQSLRRELQPLYNKRLPLYRRADIIVHFQQGKTPDLLVKQLINEIKDYVLH